MTKVAWVHSFPPANPQSGIFMHELVAPLRATGYRIELMYTGDTTRIQDVPDNIVHARRLTRDADLIHAQYGSGCGVFASFLHGPRLLTLRGSDWYGAPHEKARRMRGTLAPLFTRLSLRRYDRVCVVSNRMRSEVSRYVDASRVALIPDGIDLDHFIVRDRLEARRALGLGNDASPWVLFATVGAESAVKRPALAQAAMRVVNDLRPDVKLRVMHAIPRELVPQFVSACDVILLTSTHEGWPNIIKEGLACEVPFVSTDVGDLAAIAAKEPSCHVCEPDARVLAAAILRSLDAPRSGTLRRHAEDMSLPATIRKLSELYDRMVQ